MSCANIKADLFREHQKRFEVLARTMSEGEALLSLEQELLAEVARIEEEAKSYGGTIYEDLINSTTVENLSDPNAIDLEERLSRTEKQDEDFQIAPQEVVADAQEALDRLIADNPEDASYQALKDDLTEKAAAFEQAVLSEEENTTARKDLLRSIQKVQNLYGKQYELWKTNNYRDRLKELKQKVLEANSNSKLAERYDLFPFHEIVKTLGSDSRISKKFTKSQEELIEELFMNAELNLLEPISFNRFANEKMYDFYVANGFPDSEVIYNRNNLDLEYLTGENFGGHRNSKLTNLDQNKIEQIEVDSASSGFKTKGKPKSLLALVPTLMGMVLDQKQWSKLFGKMKLFEKDKKAFQEFVKFYQEVRTAVNKDLLPEIWSSEEMNNYGITRYAGKYLDKTLHDDPLNYFKDPDIGKLPTNLVAGISIELYNWIGTQGTATSLNDDQTITKLARISDDTQITPAMEGLLRHIGTSRLVAASSIGKQIVRTHMNQAQVSLLDGYMQERLETNVGLLALAAGAEMGLLEFNAIPGDQYHDYVLRTPAAQRPAKLFPANFVRVKSTSRDENSEPIDEVKAIADKYNNGRSLFKRLFDLQDYAVKPETEVPEKVNTEVDGSYAKMSKGIEKAVDKLQRVPITRSKPLLRQFERFGSNAQIGKYVVGIKDDLREVHITEEDSFQSKNDGLRRELEHMLEAYEEYGDTPFYLTYTQIVSGRTRVNSNRVDPQNKKVHRFGFNVPAWEHKIPYNATAKNSNVILLKLAVAQGLGIKVDIKHVSESLKQFEKDIAKPEIQDIIEVLRKEEKFTPEDLAKFITADGESFFASEEGMHTFAALTTWADYLNSKENRKQFKHHLPLEIDGITNGFISGLLQTPYDNIERLKEQLRRGGIYFVGDKEQTMADYKSNPANQDSYESVAVDTNNTINDIVSGEFGNNVILEAIDWVETSSRVRKDFIKENLYEAREVAPLMKALFDGDLVEMLKTATEEIIVATKAGRLFGKDPLMTVAYGQGIAGILEVMTNKLPGKIYSKLMTKAKEDPSGLAAATWIVDVLTMAGYSENRQAKIDWFIAQMEGDPLKWAKTFTFDRIPRIRDPLPTVQHRFAITYGIAIEDALKTALGDMLAVRKPLNTAFNFMAHTYKELFEERLRAAERQKLGSLSPYEEKQIHVKLAEEGWLPGIKHYSSEGEQDIVEVNDDSKTYIDDENAQVTLLLKKGKVAVNEVTWNSDFVTREISENPHRYSSMSGQIVRRRPSGNTRVKGIVLGTHSSDSNTIGPVYEKYKIFHVNDAAVMGLSNIDWDGNTASPFDIGQALNQSFLNVHSDWAMVNEVVERYNKFSSLLDPQDPTLSAAAKDRIINEVFNGEIRPYRPHESNGNTPAEAQFLDDLNYVARMSNDVRKRLFTDGSPDQIASVGQFSFDGAQLPVKDYTYTIPEIPNVSTDIEIRLEFANSLVAMVKDLKNRENLNKAVFLSTAINENNLDVQNTVINDYIADYKQNNGNDIPAKDLITFLVNAHRLAAEELTQKEREEAAKLKELYEILAPDLEDTRIAVNHGLSRIDGFYREQSNAIYYNPQGENLGLMFMQKALQPAITRMLREKYEKQTYEELSEDLKHVLEMADVLIDRYKRHESPGVAEAASTLDKIQKNKKLDDREKRLRLAAGMLSYGLVDPDLRKILRTTKVRAGSLASFDSALGQVQQNTQLNRLEALLRSGEALFTSVRQMQEDKLWSEREAELRPKPSKRKKKKFGQEAAMWDQFEQENTLWEQYESERDILGSTSGVTIDRRNFQNAYANLLTSETASRLFEDIKRLDGNTENTAHSAYLTELVNTIISNGLTHVDQLYQKIYTNAQGILNKGEFEGDTIYIEAAASPIYSPDKMSLQEVTAHEYIHAIFKNYIRNDYWGNKELKRLYNIAKANLDYSIFLPDRPANTHTQSEINAARETFDYIFNRGADYLQEFAAYGLTNQKLKTALENIENTPDKKKIWTGNIFSSLVNLLMRALEWMSSKVRTTRKGNVHQGLMAWAEDASAINRHAKRKLLERFDRKIMEKVDGVNKGVTDFIDNKVFQNLEDYTINRLANRPNNAGRLRSIGDLALIKFLHNRNDNFRERWDRSINNGAIRILGTGRESGYYQIIQEFLSKDTDDLKRQDLLRESVHRIDTLRKRKADTVIDMVKESFDPNKEMEDYMWQAVNDGLLRTDASTFLNSELSLRDLLKLYTDTTYRNQRIERLHNEIINTYGLDGNSYVHQAQGLGIFMATNMVAEENQQFNAYNIANHLHLGEMNSHSLDQDKVKMIDELATLHSIAHTSQGTRQNLATVMEQELARTDGGNGILDLLRIHNIFKEESLERRFDGNPTQTIKGYTAEQFDEDTLVRAAPNTPQAEAELKKEGYVKVSELPKDPDHARLYPEQMALYVNPYGLGTFQKSVVSRTSEKASGTSLMDNLLDYFTDRTELTSDLYNRAHVAARKQMVAMTRAKIQKAQNQRNKTPELHKKVPKRSVMAPVVTPEGKISDYRYLMNLDTKDQVLKRKDLAPEVIGWMFGATEDRVSSKEINKLAVQYMHDEYEKYEGNSAYRFIWVGQNSPKQEYQELWASLPKDMRIAAKEKFGSNGLFVRDSSLLYWFGFRKMRTIDLWLNKGKGDKAKRISFFKTLEEVWQELMQIIKQKSVVLSPRTLLGNAVSNYAMLFVEGIPLTYAMKHSRTAIAAMREYQQSVKKRDELAVRIKMTANPSQQMQVKLAQLEDDIRNNPVSYLIEQGLFTSILEEIDEEEFKRGKKHIANMLDKHVYNRINKRVSPAVTQGIKEFMMTPGSESYQAAMIATQYTDFIARFVKYKWDTEEKEIDSLTAIRDATKKFIFYNEPQNRALQWGNDMGFTMFTKFYFRIQPIVTEMYGERAASMIGLYMLQRMLGDIEDVNDFYLDSTSFTGRLRSPLTNLSHLGEISIFNWIGPFLGIDGKVRLFD